MYCPFSSTVHDFKLQLLYYPKILFKERFQLFNHRLFLLCAVAVTSEAAHRRQEVVDTDAGGF